jgi:hypothetical protein
MAPSEQVAIALIRPGRGFLDVRHPVCAVSIGNRLLRDNIGIAFSAFKIKVNK